MGLKVTPPSGGMNPSATVAAGAAIATHVAAADPHTVYQLRSEKNVANGYAPLDSGILVPVANLPTNTTARAGIVAQAPNDTTKFWRGDATWDVPPGGSLEVKEADGTPDVTGVTQIIVPNSSLTDNTGGSVTLTFPGGGVTVEDEGTPLSTVADTLNFVGGGVTATGSGTTKTITIPGGSSFSPPGGVDGLWTWLEADAISGLSDGDNVLQWENSVPGLGGFPARASATPPVYKTGILNSLPVVRFGGSAFLYHTSFALHAATFAWFVVFKLSSITPAYTGIIGFGQGGDAGGYFIKSNGKSAEYPISSGSTYDGTGSATFDTTNWNYVADIHGPGQTYTTRRNGSADASGIGWTNAAFLTYEILIGSQYVSGRTMTGDIAEVLIYGRALSSSEVSSVESYLTTKYGL